MYEDYNKYPLSKIVSFGGFCDKTYKQYHLVKVVHSKDAESCLKGRFLIGSVKRNKEFDDARGDSKETSIEYRWINRNKKEWFLSEKDCSRFFHPDVLEKLKFKSMKGRGDITFKNSWVSDKNIFSLSLGLIKKSNKTREKKDLKKLIASLEMPESSVAIKITNPNKFIEAVTPLLMKLVGGSLMPCASWIKYTSRITYSDTFERFVEKLHNEFSGRNLDLFFLKPPKYKNDRELRMIWLSHKNKDWKCINTNEVGFQYECPDYKIINMGEFSEYFEIFNP
ncbi:hypothetical protein OAD42_01220 [Oceanospirillaceae bacterium]|nr:hypothetical protein [Oceanospirillaceae bacterium]